MLLLVYDLVRVTICFVCLFVLMLNVPVNNFQSCRDGATASWACQYFSGSECVFAQGHNTAEVSIEIFQ